jgi:small subunit ribosomal protein S4
MLRNIRQAQKQSGATGDLLIQLLERRLDNVIFRLNFADSRKQGRQLVLHGHFTVNGRKVDVPSFVVRPGDEIAWKETSLAKDFIDVVRQGLSKRTIPDWLVQNSDGLTAKVSKLPDVASTGTSVDTRLIVEFYSR